MRMTLRSLALLLGYPSADLKAHADEFRTVLADEKVLSRSARRRLEPLLSALGTEDLLDLQAGYSELFDRSRALSLHLFEHVHGDSRDRGQAMIDLGERYIAHGCLLDSQELPDFVPVFVQFASCLEPAEARDTLSQPAHVFAALEERLRRRGSPYAAVFHALVELGGAKPDADALCELNDNAPSDDLSKIDEEWEEAPVSFTAHEMGGPTGMIAKLRAACKDTAAVRSNGGGS